MKMFLTGLIAAFFLCGTALADTYLKDAPDIPVFDGFGETESFGSAFDKPEGRIIEAWVTGKKPADEAIRLYKTSLPQLGWTIEGELELKRSGDSGRGPILVFKRKSERLKITVYADTSDVSLLRFDISPLRK